ncbi:MAG: type II toxin-antitoxin system RelE/ParE family toxin [Bacteroidales bacterium]
MAVKLVWTKKATQGYDRIIKYLEEEWSEKEVRNFVRETAHFFDLLKENPKMLEPPVNIKTCIVVRSIV